MALKSAKIDRKEKTITIVLDLEDEPHRSRSGKAMIVSSSHGSALTDFKIDDKAIYVSANAYFRV